MDRRSAGDEKNMSPEIGDICLSDGDNLPPEKADDKTANFRAWSENRNITVNKIMETQFEKVQFR